MKRYQKLSIALESVSYSSLAYEGAFLANNLKSDYFKNDFWVWHFDNDNRILFLSIRGTDDWKDLFKDISILPKKLKGVGYVHRGFLSSARAVLTRSLAQINHASEIGYKIALSGHSYGGAVAQVMQQILRKSYNIHSECVSYGSPRVWFPYAKPKGLHLRVQIDSDPVTKMPFVFGWALRLYRHKETDMLEVTTPDYFKFTNHAIATYERLLEKERFNNGQP